MHLFVITPFEGAFPLRFGMSPEEIIELFGPPQTCSLGWKNVLHHHYLAPGLDLSISFGGPELTADRFWFGRGQSVFFEGLDLFGDPAAWRAVVERSRDCQELSGFLFCCDLGIQLNDFHIRGDGQPRVVIFPRGAFEHYRPHFQQFELERYDADE